TPRGSGPPRSPSRPAARPCRARTSCRRCASGAGGRGGRGHPPRGPCAARRRRRRDRRPHGPADAPSRRRLGDSRPDRKARARRPSSADARRRAAAGRDAVEALLLRAPPAQLARRPAVLAHLLGPQLLCDAEPVRGLAVAPLAEASQPDRVPEEAVLAAIEEHHAGLVLEPPGQAGAEPGERLRLALPLLQDLIARGLELDAHHAALGQARAHAEGELAASLELEGIPEVAEAARREPALHERLERLQGLRSEEHT